MWARLENNIVRELINFNPEGKYHPSLIWMECDESVATGMVYSASLEKFLEKDYNEVSAINWAQNRKIEYLKAWPVEKQLEAYYDALAKEDSAKLDKMLADFEFIKTKFPKP